MERIKLYKIVGNYIEILAWLEKHIEPCDRHGAIGNPQPYHFSAVSQFARYTGITDQWHMDLRGYGPKITVEIQDPKLAVQFSLQWTR